LLARPGSLRLVVQPSTVRTHWRPAEAPGGCRRLQCQWKWRVGSPSHQPGQLASHGVRTSPKHPSTLFQNPPPPFFPADAAAAPLLLAVHGGPCSQGDLPLARGRLGTEPPGPAPRWPLAGWHCRLASELIIRAGAVPWHGLQAFKCPLVRKHRRPSLVTVPAAESGGRAFLTSR
jgi:hypothetical protein